MKQDTLKNICQGILEYLIPYFWGMLAALIFTPADTTLVGAPIWLVYPVLAIPAYFLVSTIFTFHNIIDYIFAALYVLSFWCILFGIATNFGSLRQYAHLRPKIIGFTFGFVGTAGVYFIACESI